jgi:hypothetical protein
MYCRLAHTVVPMRRCNLPLRKGRGWLWIGTTVEAQKLQHRRENVSNATEREFLPHRLHIICVQCSCSYYSETSVVWPVKVDGYEPVLC